MVLDLSSTKAKVATSKDRNTHGNQTLTDNLEVAKALALRNVHGTKQHKPLSQTSIITQIKKPGSEIS